MTNKEDFIKKLRETFKIEATEGIEMITADLMELEKENSDQLNADLIESIFRNAHSLKGAARAVNFSEIENICQAMEGVFSDLKNKTLLLNSDLLDLLHLTINLIDEILQQSEQTINFSLKEKVLDVVAKLHDIKENENDVATNTINENELIETQITSNDNRTIPEFRNIDSDEVQNQNVQEKIRSVVSKSDGTVRISIEKLDHLLNQTEEMMVIKQTFNHLNKALNGVFDKLSVWEHEQASTFPFLLKIKQNILDLEENSNHKNIFQFLDWSASVEKTIADDLERIRKMVIQEGYSSGVKIESLLDDVKQILSVPFATILDGYPKIARDLSNDQGKKVEIEIIGSDLEIDRRILEELRIPLMHLLRNSIDHGIELPEDRLQKNKPETGKIKIAVDRMENSRVEVVFSDDGAGVDLEKVKQQFLKREKGNNSDVDENTLLESLFKSGFTTSEMITDISGRGLGLSIVKEKIEQLGGTVIIINNKNSGLEFKIEIPLTLVTFRGVSLLIGEREFIIPTSKINRVLRISKSNVLNVENKATIPFNNKVIPLNYLSDILEMPVKENDESHLLVIVLGNSEQELGFIVDDVLDEDVILLKMFNPQLTRVRNIEGATVVGSGKVIPVLNVSDIIKSSFKGTSYRVNNESVPKEKNTILIVEDSITSRMLLKNILETSGYKVSIAIDGVDGFTRLKESPVDLVVSDVDMPRMSGFDMTAKIRSDKTLADTPVVLVTSLSKREDRERGLEVGANAYIVKSNFDQSNLLEVIEKLIGN